MWLSLLTLAPGLIPIIIDTIINVESVVSGVLKGEIKKEKVLAVVRAILDTKDYFTKANSDYQNMILTLTSEAIDIIVSAFNFLGLFKTSKKLDFTPKTGGA